MAKGSVCNIFQQHLEHFSFHLWTGIHWRTYQFKGSICFFNQQHLEHYCFRPLHMCLYLSYFSISRLNVVFCEAHSVWVKHSISMYLYLVQETMQSLCKRTGIWTARSCHTGSLQWNLGILYRARAFFKSFTSLYQSCLSKCIVKSKINT